MYRRDISHVLRLLGLLLLALVLYQLWIKPTYFEQIPAPSSIAPAAEPSPSSTSRTEPVAIPDVPQTRLIDPGESPLPELAQIHDDLERGNYKAVESALQRFSGKELLTKQARQYAAALWNNLGAQQEKYGGIDVSVKAFERAVALDPGNPTALLNLTQAYWGLRDPALTPEFLQTVIRSAPKDPFPHLALADILIEKGLTTEALQHLSLSEASASTDSNLQVYFRQLTTKLDRRGPDSPRGADLAAGFARTPLEPVAATRQEPVIPIIPSELPKVASGKPSPDRATDTAVRQFKPRSGEHFTIRFDGQENPDNATQIRSILEYAHEEMSQKFGHVPAHPIPVVLHTGQKFSGHAGNPSWADTLYDSMSGTIHVPLEGALDDLALLSRVVRHEFAHALLHEKVGTHTNHLPAWLAEGLAIQLAEDPWPDLDDAKQQTRLLLPLSTLQPSWTQLPRDSWILAYHESLAATQSLIDQYSMYGVRQVLNAIQMGQSLDGAMQQKLAVSYAQFHKAWEKQYTARVPAGNS